MSEWQPIETAPKNETDILLFRRGKYREILPPIVAGWFANNTEPGWYTYDDPDRPVYGVLVAWMPVPDAPK